MNPLHEADYNGRPLSYSSDPSMLKPRPADPFYRATPPRMNPNLPGFEADKDQFPPIVEFENIVQDYLQNLSTKKRDKALVDRQRYQLILQVLKDPRNTAISTAQFRFWVKKMFQLKQVDKKDIVCHDDKPVAMREHIYAILVHAHREAHHGGRDKTSALVRKRYSWIPKELIARFVRHCPFCITRRNGCQSPTLVGGNEPQQHHEPLSPSRGYVKPMIMDDFKHVDPNLSWGHNQQQAPPWLCQSMQDNATLLPGFVDDTTSGSSPSSPFESYDQSPSACSVNTPNGAGDLGSWSNSLEESKQQDRFMNYECKDEPYDSYDYFYPSSPTNRDSTLFSPPPSNGNFFYTAMPQIPTPPMSYLFPHHAQYAHLFMENNNNNTNNDHPVKSSPGATVAAAAAAAAAAATNNNAANPSSSIPFILSHYQQKMSRQQDSLYTVA